MSTSVVSKSTIVDVSLTSPHTLTWLTSSGTLRHYNTNNTTFSHTLRFPTASRLAVSHDFYTISDHTRPLHLRHVSTANGNIHKVTKASTSTSTSNSSIIAFTPAVTKATQLHGFYAVQDGNFIRVHSYASNTVLLLFPMNSSSSIMTARLAHTSTTPTLLVTGEYSGQIQVYTMFNQALEPSSYQFNLHKRATSDICIVESTIFVVSWDGKLSIISNATTAPKHMLTSTRLIKSPGRLLCVSATVSAFQNSSFLVAVGGDDLCVRVWSVSSSCTSFPKTELFVFDYHSSPINTLSFMNSTILSGCMDGSIRLFTLSTPSMFITNTSKLLPFLDEQEYTQQHLNGFVKRMHSSRKLIYIPCQPHGSSCSICEKQYDTSEHAPMCCGNCGRTFGCFSCYKSFFQANFDSENSVKCPLCQQVLYDVGFDHDHLLMISPEKNERSDSEETELIDIHRLTWSESPILSDLSTCKLVMGTFDNQSVILRIPKSDIDKLTAVNDTFRHLSIINSIKAPHVANHYGICKDSETEHFISVEELPIGGTLQSNLQQSTYNYNLNENSYLQICTQLMFAIRSLHQHNISLGHSLLPSCIGLDSSLIDTWGSQGQRLKLLEFSGACNNNIDDADQRIIPLDFIPYAAPEILEFTIPTTKLHQSKLSQSKNDLKADMYTLGILLWQIATGKTPFDGLSPMRIISKVIELDEKPGRIPHWLPSKIKRLIGRLWSKHVNERPDISEACQILNSIPSAPPIVDEEYYVRNDPTGVDVHRPVAAMLSYEMSSHQHTNMNADDKDDGMHSMRSTLSPPIFVNTEQVREDRPKNTTPSLYPDPL